jgi:hypothetical protein
VGTSRPRFIAALGALLIIGVLISALAITGRFSDLRHANIPIVHPYPPAGFEFDALNPGNEDDLVRISDANQVRADLLRDGDAELSALEHGDASLLLAADAGGRLAKLQAHIARDKTAGIVEIETNQMESIIVGHYRDPADASVIWCVHEVGHASVLTKSLSVASQQSVAHFRFDGRFWLRKTGSHYLIIDADVANAPEAS